MPLYPGNSRRLAGVFLGQYGMLLVLGLLCGYYSIATVSDYHPSPAEAARQIAERAKRGHRVLVVVRPTEADTALLAALATAFKDRGVSVLATVQGEPRDARIALEKANNDGQAIDIIATTAECAAWTLLRKTNERFPALGHPEIMTARSVRWPIFLTRQNLLNVANQITVVAILAIGMTVVVLTGGIDLSVGSLIALSAVSATVLIRDWAGGPAATPVALCLCSGAAVLLCALAGLFTGVMVAVFKAPSFIATLAVMQAASGLAFMAAKGGSIYEVPESFSWLGRSAGPFGVPNAVWLMFSLFLATHILLSRTILGRHIYAVGGNPETARLCGIKITLVLLLAYTFSGAMAGLGGVLQASQLKSGSPTYGAMYELYAIAAVVVGGTSLRGGEGRVFGTLIGALIIAVIQNGMNLTGTESYRQKVILGLVILGAVLLDLLKKADWTAFTVRR